MAIPAITCPQCAHPLTVALDVCPACGYQFTVHRDLPPDQAADPQPQASAIPSALSAAIPDQQPQQTAPVPTTVVCASHAQPTPPKVTGTPQTTVVPSADRAIHPRPSALHRSVRLVLAMAVVLAVISSVAVGAYHALPILSRLIQMPQGTATAVPVGTVLFQDPLTAKAHDWTNDQHCSFASDGYHVRDGYECYAPTAQQRNITLSVTARQLSGPADQRYGLGLRLNAVGDEYLFAIDSNGRWLFGKYIAGVFTTIVSPAASAAIKQGLGSTNTLTVRAIGAHFEFFINGTPVGTADDTALDVGYCGVEGSRGAEIVFTRLTIVKAA